MRKKMELYAPWLLVLLGMPLAAHAGMSSASYRIDASVLSGGGAPMNSASYRLNSTLGQSTPLMNPDDICPPWSISYENYPGFWYTFKVAAACVLNGDLDGDKDVDIDDYRILKNNYGSTGGSVADIDGDGDVDIDDYRILKNNYGSTCP